MAKIKTAKDILKEKGYVENKFDTNGFLEKVAEMFAERGIEDHVLIKKMRFVVYKNGQISEEENRRGWITIEGREEIVAEHKKKWDSNDLSYFDMWDKYGSFICGLSEDTIIVDEPFFKNAAWALRTLGGYVAKLVTRSGEQHYDVTLI